MFFLIDLTKNAVIEHCAPEVLNESTILHNAVMPSNDVVLSPRHVLKKAKFQAIFSMAVADYIFRVIKMVFGFWMSFTISDVIKNKRKLITRRQL